MAKRKYFPEQKEGALTSLEACVEDAVEVEKALYNKFRKEYESNNEFCKEFKDYCSFINWYCRRIKKQNGKCFYCGLEGDVTSNYRKQLKKIGMLEAGGFRDGNRGRRLEIDRKSPKGLYNSRNMALACYPCNNAKSDVFSQGEFKIIGAVIGGLKNREKTIKIKKFMKGLV